MRLWHVGFFRQEDSNIRQTTSGGIATITRGISSGSGARNGHLYIRMHLRVLRVAHEEGQLLDASTAAVSVKLSIGWKRTPVRVLCMVPQVAQDALHLNKERRKRKLNCNAACTMLSPTS
jgi:hypothetical protein